MSKPLIIFLVAIVVRLALFAFAAPWQTENLPEKLLHSDGKEYHKIGVNLATKGIFTTSKQYPYHPRLERVPLYPGYLAAVYATVGVYPWVAVLGQILISAWTAVILFRIGHHLFSRAAGWIAGLFFAADYTSVLISNMLLSDTLFTFFFLLHILYLLRYFQVTGGFRKTGTETSQLQSPLVLLLLAAIFLGIATLTHPVSIYFSAVILPLIFWRNRHRWAKGLLHALIFVFTVALLLTPWSLRYYSYKGELLLTSQQKKILWWNAQHLKKSFHSPKNVSAASQQKAQENHPGNPAAHPGYALLSDLRNYGNGMLRMFFVVSSSDLFKLLGVSFTPLPDDLPARNPLPRVTATFSQKHPFEQAVIAGCLLYLALLYLLGWAGLFRLFRKKQYLPLALFAGVIFYFILAAAPAAFTAKYRLPVLPVLMLAAAYGIATPRSKQKSDGRQPEIPDYHPPWGGSIPRNGNTPIPERKT